MAAVALALAASVCWGAADFVGGVASRRASVVIVLAVSQAAGLVLIVAVAAALGRDLPPAGPVGLALVGSLVGFTGIVCLYLGLAAGPMSVVAPIAGTSAAVPVIVGVALGDRPSTVQGAGLGLAIVGIVLAAREPEHGGIAESRVLAGVGYALGAALGLGFGLLIVDAVTARVGDPLWSTAALRIAPTAVSVAAVAAARPRLPRGVGGLGPLLAIGVLDAGATALFADASTRELVSVVAVLASLYPVVVVLLARLTLGERLGRLQDAGVVAALAGVALISAG